MKINYDIILSSEIEVERYTAFSLKIVFRVYNDMSLNSNLTRPLQRWPVYQLRKSDFRGFFLYHHLLQNILWSSVSYISHILLSQWYYYYLPKTLSICLILFWEQVLWIGKICLLLFEQRQRLCTAHSTAGVWRCMLESSLSTSSHLYYFTFSRLCTRVVWCDFYKHKQF